MHGSIIEEKDGYTVEHIAHTYSEEENQRNKVNANNAELPFNVKYLNIQLHRLDTLSVNEALVYAFIDLFLGGNTKFFAGDKRISATLRMSEKTVSRAVKKLKDLGLITTRHVRKGKGTMRYITLNEQQTNGPLLSGQKDGLYTNSFINNNNISILDSRNPEISFLFSKLKNNYGLDKDYIEQAFEKKKTLFRILEVCQFIEALSGILGVEPVYNKRTINCFDIITSKVDNDGIREALYEYRNIYIDSPEKHNYESIEEIVESDYYLPTLMGLCN